MSVSDDVSVFEAELVGLQRLARLDRPQVPVRGEDLPGALCLWNAGDGSHRDEVRLVPGSGVPLIGVLRAARDSRVRSPGGDLQIRGVAASFDAAAVGVLRKLDGVRDTAGPHALMAADLVQFEPEPPAGFTATVARDAESLAELRSVVGQVYAGYDATDKPERANRPNADFYHAPGTMTYLAVSENGRVVSTGSILVVDGVANVWSVATLPAARGRGAASAVMRAACAEARAQGAMVAALRTTDDLARPDGLYARLGFSLVGHEHAWNVDAVDRLDL